MLPLIGLVTVKLVNVPTDVRLELTTFDAKVVPAKDDAVGVTAVAEITPLLIVIEVPSTLTPPS